MGLSPGLDFETKLFAKPDAAELLEKELAKPGYAAKTIAIGTNTDPYQPIEKQLPDHARRSSRCWTRTNHPVGIVTKSALVTRDIDILAPMAERGLAKVALSVTTLDPQLARTMEPRAATPAKRLEAIRAARRGRHSGVGDGGADHPGLNDQEIERILEGGLRGRRARGRLRAAAPAARGQGDLPRMAVGALSGQLRHVMSLVRRMRGGKDYDSAWGKRLTGAGPYAWMIGRRFELALRAPRLQPRPRGRCAPTCSRRRRARRRGS